MSQQLPPSADWVGHPTVDAVFDVVRDTAAEVREALPERRAYVEGHNPSGEKVRAADEYADELFCERLLALDSVGSYASEERESAREADDGGEYHLALDPLDGSSNLTSNNPMGTIVSVYDEPVPTGGDHLVAAAFVLYGPNTTMVVSDGETVDEYLIEDGAGESADEDGEGRKLLREDLTLPDDPTVYAFGGRRPDWTDGVTAAVEDLEADRLKLRYGGAFIADVMQVLTHGGVFAYPELADAPEGKLRYCFECAPVGFVVEAAGGRASAGYGDLFESDPDRLHARSPVYLGNDELVDRVEATLS
ncbi:fructose-1,6-bisphosphatase [Halosimplex litoreum]|uniref:Fructose-1,6-bisphosphatase class 1 n=1 Tax=Halosimplex litoreum TaxID=1198301 RepID=A0A7T3G036_9EURY|nr:class 1 fructose-bisphosphatase [Halosimplex litoreum]QPV63905.1 fructose-1,6-bisphosphatase [Halosimplex litoreum]